MSWIKLINNWSCLICHVSSGSQMFSNIKHHYNVYNFKTFWHTNVFLWYLHHSQNTLYFRHSCTIDSKIPFTPKGGKFWEENFLRYHSSPFATNGIMYPALQKVTQMGYYVPNVTLQHGYTSSIIIRTGMPNGTKWPAFPINSSNTDLFPPYDVGIYYLTCEGRIWIPSVFGSKVLLVHWYIWRVRQSWNRVVL